MAYQADHKHDIFVSYAHVDNMVGPGATKGWVSTLVEAFKLNLGKALGRMDAFTIWMDPSLPGNEPVTAEILGHLRDSALLLVVLSPGYAASTWCLREKNAFLDVVKRWHNPDSRVFVVEHLPVEKEQRPPEFGELPGYSFWRPDDNGLARPVSAVAPVFEEAQFHQALNKLVADLAKKLMSLRAAAAEPRAQPASGIAASQALVSAANPGRVAAVSRDLHDPERAAGLFVGVGDFDPRAYLARLRYAADDAVALAHLFVLELNLIAPPRARLALGGTPASKRAQGWLQALTDAGVSVVPATRSELLYALDELTTGDQGRDALGLVTFCTHGLEEAGTVYLMPADGSRRFMADTGLKLTAVHDVLTRLPAERRILIVDACRSSLESPTRGEAMMTDDFRQALEAPSGMALLASCSVGQLSWEAPEFEHGVFTHFLVEGMRGDASAGLDDGIIRLQHIIDFTFQRTTDWVRRALRSEQLPWFVGDEHARAMPLAVSVEARRRADEEARQTRALADRKQRALDALFAARGTAGNRRIIPASVQGEVEAELDMRDESELDELLERLEALGDRRQTSCKLFMLWWQAQPRRRLIELVPPSLDGRWENSLGMAFVPVGSVLFGVWPVRVQDFHAFVNETGHDATSGLFSFVDGKWLQRSDSWKNQRFPQGPMHPVAGVSWEDADAFCRWLTMREAEQEHIATGLRYRLPTDAEWSVAVGRERYPWGDEWPPPPDAGHYMTTGAPPKVGTAAVGSYRANACGIHDLGGNVWEWCDGWYAKELNPPELRERFEFMNDDGGGTSYRLMRGASWFNGEDWQLRSAYRNTGKVPNVRFSNVGFRCVLELPQTPEAIGFQP